MSVLAGRPREQLLEELDAAHELVHAAVGLPTNAAQDVDHVRRGDRAGGTDQCQDDLDGAGD